MKLIIHIASVLLVFMACSCVRTVRESDLFHPTQAYYKGPYNKTLEHVSLKTGQHVELQGLLLKKPGSQDIIVYFYGNASCVYYARSDNRSSCNNC